MCGPVEAQVVTDWCRVCEMEPYGPMPTTTSSSTGAPRAWGAHACTRAPCIVQSALIVQRPCANCGCAAQANEQGMILAGKKEAMAPFVSAYIVLLLLCNPMLRLSLGQCLIKCLQPRSRCIYAGAYPSACAGEGTLLCVHVNTHVQVQVDTHVLAYGRASQGLQCNSRVKVRAMGGWSQQRSMCMCVHVQCAM